MIGMVVLGLVGSLLLVEIWEGKGEALNHKGFAKWVHQGTDFGV